ncbi:hypothetical protein ABZ990_02960 [Streptomyces sp. NPDC046203]|uniref:hypothetical protein n=1 Tax=Streptomyces sp. NPDC046203 TaxID=3154602 RepID=UPI0033E35BC3
MGLVLFPGDGDDGTPDVSWSYSGFAVFRRRPAEAEGFDLSEMRGFGGERLWTEVSTALEPLLDHPGTGGADLPPAACASMLGRLREIIERWVAESAGDPRLRRAQEDARRLAEVLRLCVEKDVPHTPDRSRRAWGPGGPTYGESRCCCRGGR